MWQLLPKAPEYELFCQSINGNLESYILSCIPCIFRHVLLLLQLILTLKNLLSIEM